MNLYQLTIFINEKDQEFKGVVQRKAKGLRLSDITEGIQLDAQYFVRRNWENGQKIEIPLCEHRYTAIIDPHSLVLLGIHRIEIARFTGERIRRYYNRLSKTILEAKQKASEDLPF